MQGKIDATCATCGDPITWDTNYPKLCGHCFRQLMRDVKRTAEAELKAPREPTERAESEAA